jgi:hypothetical protein
MSRKFERRYCVDRRLEELGPPSGWKDRRRRTERRIPEIGVCEVSESEWLHYFGGVGKTTASIAPDLAADIFERARE